MKGRIYFFLAVLSMEKMIFSKVQQDACWSAAEIPIYRGNGAHIGPRRSNKYLSDFIKITLSMKIMKIPSTKNQISNKSQ
jgi:hypothetical protein